MTQVEETSRRNKTPCSYHLQAIFGGDLETSLHMEEKRDLSQVMCLVS